MEYHFHLSLSYEECKQYYSGVYSAIQVRAHTGQTVRFPADKIRPFVTGSGIHGRFTLVVDDNNKFLALRRA